MTRLEAAPVRARLVHPRTGIAEEVEIDAEIVAAVIFGALYVPLATSLIPDLIVRAEANDFQGMLALAMINEGMGQNMAIGMQLSVVCAEDHPRITPEDIERETAGSMFAKHLLISRQKACDIWPKAQVAPAYYEPVVSDAPVLVLSGDLDPVTPPTWGEGVLPHLRNARHVVVPATGHGTLTTGCGGRIIREFLDEGSAQDLDTSCTRVLKRPPFFVSPAGPDPSANRGPSQP
jgi:pimeloyl-ACP methyl ester carboxylesterase